MIVDLPIESYGFLQSRLYFMRPKKNRVEFDWKMDAIVQCSQECPVCGNMFFGETELVYFGNWMVHEECYPHWLKAEEREVQTNAELCEWFRVDPNTLGSFSTPSMCRACRTLSFVNSVLLCPGCYEKA